MTELDCCSIEIRKIDYTSFARNSATPRLFQFNPSDYYGEIASLKMNLNDHELERAQKYHFEKDAHQFIVCRAILKVLLAQELNCKVSDIQLSKDKNIKPTLNMGDLHFNLSHTLDCALILIHDHPVGVDVEHINYHFDFKDVLEYSFTLSEKRKILTSVNKKKAFFTYWTRKEALLKMIGKGMDENLLGISLTDGIRHLDYKELKDVNHIMVRSFNISDSYAAAIAVKDNGTISDKILICDVPPSIAKLTKMYND